MANPIVLFRISLLVLNYIRQNTFFLNTTSHKGEVGGGYCLLLQAAQYMK